MAEAALSAQDLGVQLGGRPVLRGVSFHAQAGGVHAILGPNGAGKTTLLRTLAGLLPYRGSIEVGGRDLGRLDRRERARTMTLVPQRSQLTSRVPVATLVGHGRYAHGDGLGKPREDDRRRVAEAMERTDVAQLAHRDFPDLSYGEQRRVLLARALATGARILLLDEPAASLDIAHALSLYALLRELAGDGHCVVAVMHQLDDALRFTDDALLLHEGRPAAAGPTPQVVTAEHVRRVYRVELAAGEGLAFRLPGGGAP